MGKYRDKPITFTGLLGAVAPMIIDCIKAGVAIWT